MLERLRSIYRGQQSATKSNPTPSSQASAGLQTSMAVVWVYIMPLIGGLFHYTQGPLWAEFLSVRHLWRSALVSISKNPVSPFSSPPPTLSLPE